MCGRGQVTFEKISKTIENIFAIFLLYRLICRCKDSWQYTVWTQHTRVTDRRKSELNGRKSTKRSAKNPSCHCHLVYVLYQRENCANLCCFIKSRTLKYPTGQNARTDRNAYIQTLQVTYSRGYGSFWDFWEPGRPAVTNDCIQRRTFDLTQFTLHIGHFAVTSKVNLWSQYNSSLIQLWLSTSCRDFSATCIVPTIMKSTSIRFQQTGARSPARTDGFWTT